MNFEYFPNYLATMYFPSDMICSFQCGGLAQLLWNFFLVILHIRCYYIWYCFQFQYQFLLLVVKNYNSLDILTLHPRVLLIYLLLITLNNFSIFNYACLIHVINMNSFKYFNVQNQVIFKYDSFNLCFPFFTDFSFSSHILLHRKCNIMLSRNCENTYFVSFKLP
jgi:hypothetical protein